MLFPTSSRAAKIFQARDGTRRQGNACQGNVGHSPDTNSSDQAVLANLGVLWVERAAHPFGCGSAALCLFVAIPSAEFRLMSFTDANLLKGQSALAGIAFV
jgi:hypothetical protein